MRALGNTAFFVGLLSLVVAVASRWHSEPIRGIEAHAILQFVQVCVLIAIAAYVHPRTQ